MSYVCHIEIPVKDLKEAEDFYGYVFGWQVNIDERFKDYALWQAKKEPGGGFYRTEDIRVGHPMVHIYVEDIEEILNKVEEKGGKVIHPKTPIGPDAEIGYFAIFEDIFGNQLGLYTK